MGDGSNKADDTKAELLSRLNGLLERLLKEKTDEPSPGFQRFIGAIKAFLQSTFFLTVVSGVLLAWLPFRWQDRAARQREKESGATQIVERKDRLAYQFARDFPLTLHLAGRFRKRELWMHEPEAHKPDARYTDARTFAETRDYSDRLIEKYFSLGPPASMCNQIVASFPHSTNIVSLAGLLSTNVTSLLLATNSTNVDSAYDLANIHYQFLTEAIFTELNKTNENTKQE